jgi:Tfp pilus assembly protein PilN
MDWTAVVTPLASLAAGFGTGYFTRRTAKESNAGQLYSTLTKSQTDELLRMAARITALEEDRKADAADREESRQRVLAYEKWGRALLRRLREVLPEEEFPDPPPLDL